MHYLFSQVDAVPAWLQYVLKPSTMPFLVAIVAILGGAAIALAKAAFRHRERMAKIEHGIDPDEILSASPPQSNVN